MQTSSGPSAQQAEQLETEGAAHGKASETWGEDAASVQKESVATKISHSFGHLMNFCKKSTQGAQIDENTKVSSFSSNCYDTGIVLACLSVLYHIIVTVIAIVMAIIER